MAVDLGDSRTGLACCDRTETLASPIGVLHEKNPESLLRQVALAVEEYTAGLVVVGYPKHMNNSVGERARKSEDFAQRLEKMTGIPVVLWDERGTTVSATGYLNETNTRGKKRKNVIDAVAAVIILENYITYRQNHPDVT